MTDQDLVDFMKRFSSIFYCIVLLFLTSILSVVGQLLFATSVLYPADDYLILFAFAGVFLVWCLVMAVATLYFIGSRLWYRVKRQSDRIRHSEIKSGMERAMDRAVNHMNIFLEHKLESELENILEDAVVTQVGDVLGKLMESTMKSAIHSVMDNKKTLDDMVEEAMDRASLATNEQNRI